jgi:hypothetical protein
MARATGPDRVFLLQFLDGVVQSEPDEVIGFPVKSGVFLAN